VGHLKTKRSLDAFLTLQELPDVHGIVVASTSTRPDEQVRASLHAAGVTVIDTYVPAIEDVYRLSALYLFLAESETAAIELPLSVLEAMACNLPIVTTPFGGLADVFPAGNGLIYWDGSTDLRALIDAALSSPSSTRSLVAARTWAAAAGTLEGLLFDNANPSRAAQPEATR
jgi:glycosyltransferase involved in cell wall biosynthesis